MCAVLTSRNTFSILFFIHRSKTNKNNEHPIYCRLTVKGKPNEFSTQLWVKNEKWNPTAGKIIGTNEFAKTSNYVLATIKNSLMQIRADLQSKGKLITAKTVINVHLGKSEKNYTLIQLLEYFNEQHVKKLIGKDYALGTYNRYKTSLEHIKQFIQYKYKVDDLFLTELSYSFATDYEFYLKTVQLCGHNTAVKYIKNLKAVLNFALSQEWLEMNPLNRYKAKLDRVEKEYLNESELNKIESKEISNTRIDEVRDIFVFCCYTGLSYSDVEKLTNKNIVIGMNGQSQINIRRTKTDVTAKIPLLDKAKAIIQKYSTHEECIYYDKILPVKSNQKHNAYL